uniref:Uncharacterized protein n=1 Tax=Molossus molossus TaxID=27622 RepID=A0A7J8HBP1_MOLMO|nr:hypothetical protein HJG59_011136 [Molossus molossus]
MLSLIFRQREGEGERNMDWPPPARLPLGMGPATPASACDRESNPRPPAARVVAQPLSHTSKARLGHLTKVLRAGKWPVQTPNPRREISNPTLSIAEINFCTIKQVSAELRSTDERTLSSTNRAS